MNSFIKKSAICLAFLTAGTSGAKAQHYNSELRAVETQCHSFARTVKKHAGPAAIAFAAIAGTLSAAALVHNKIRRARTPKKDNSKTA